MSDVDNTKSIREDCNKKIHDTDQSSYINLYKVVLNMYMLNYMVFTVIYKNKREQLGDVIAAPGGAGASPMLPLFMCLYKLKCGSIK